MLQRLKLTMNDAMCAHVSPQSVHFTSVDFRIGMLAFSETSASSPDYGL